MHAERSLIARLESGNVDTLIEMLQSGDERQQAALRAYFGPNLHDRLTALAHKSVDQGARGRHDREKVVFIHDFFGGGLSSLKGGKQELLWMAPAKLIDGAFGRLRLGPSGVSASDDTERITASGVIKVHYSELLLTLAQHYGVLAFAYDWRKHPAHAAMALDEALTQWLDGASPFHIVTHGSGALVLAAYLRQFAPKAKTVRDGSRIVMLGPPLRGTHFATQMLTGTAHVQRALAEIDVHLEPAEIADITRTFPGIYMLLPKPGSEPLDLYDPATYGDIGISSHHLEAAKSFHASITDAVFPGNLTIILGTGQRTPLRIADADALKSASSDDPVAAMQAYAFTWHGDGIVSLDRGHLPKANTYTVEERHDLLPSNPTVLAALHPLLSGKTNQVILKRLELPNEPVPESPGKDGLATEDWAQKIVRYVGRQAQRLEQRGLEAIAETCITTEERDIMHYALPLVVSTRAAADRHAEPNQKRNLPSVKITIAIGGIDNVDKIQGLFGVDAIALGHYRDAPIGQAITALDRSITEALDDEPNGPAGTGVIGALLSRRIAGQEVGQILCLPDPRPYHSSRLIMIAGMGAIGKFGGPEAAKLAREVCLTAALLHKKHLAMLLLGSGAGNLSIREAVSRVLQGIKEAKWTHRDRGLNRITFIEFDPNRALAIYQMVDEERALLDRTDRLHIEVTLLQAHPQATTSAVNSPEEEDRPPRDEDTATRITISMEENSDTYKFSALTREASVPEREIRFDPSLVKEANDSLVSADSFKQQCEWGHALGKMLLPKSFRDEIFAGTSVVFLVDRVSARIPWEMIVDSGWTAPSDGNREKDASLFLGIGRGLTRQLKTRFAPPPHPYTPPNRLMRVLVVANPALDAPLPGAEEEGTAVAALFERYEALVERDKHSGENDRNQVEVVRLFGADATRMSVITKIMSRTFDVLHFAGHCDRDQDNEYGWIFKRNPLQLITRREIVSLERVPGFVFSNACESGITSGRPEGRSADMAPSFAESFFAAGVSNFVCTAWPVDDAAARTFAIVFYATLLGLRLPADPNALLDVGAYELAEDGPRTAQEAMKEARLALTDPVKLRAASKMDAGALEERQIEDARTWGAYQYYGNPSFRLFRTCPS